MIEQDLAFLVPRAVGMGVRMRRKMEHFSATLYTEGGKDKIGYGYDLEHGITEPVATTLIKSRLNAMGQALMRKAFETNLATDPARFAVFIDMAERCGEEPVLRQSEMWRCARERDYWGLQQAFLCSPLIPAYGADAAGRRRVAYISKVLVQGAEGV